MLALLPLAALGIFVDVSAAARLQSAAVILDARDSAAFEEGHLPGAVRADWRAFVEGRGGRLSPDQALLGARVAALGVDAARPVLVYGAAGDSWGEEGRLAWMLCYLGHGGVHLLDGGLEAWRRAGRALEQGPAAVPAPGRFRAHPRPELRVEAGELARGVAAGRLQALDVRSRAEFEGATPHGSARGGHVPGARHLEWKALLDGRGQVLPPDAIRRLLRSVGVDPRRPVAVYCTAGVRAGLAWAALRAAGLSDVRSYEASFFDWAARAELPVARGAPSPAAPRRSARPRDAKPSREAR